jgi:aldehyde dehydrogenase (NAD+)
VSGQLVTIVKNIRVNRKDKDMATIRMVGEDMVRTPGRFFIGGDWVAPSTSSMFNVVSPSTEEVFLRVAEAKATDVDRAVAAARAAFDKGTWPRLSHAERASYLRAIAAGIMDGSDRLANIWMSQIGVIGPLAHRITPACAQVFEFHAGLAESFPFEERHTPQAGGNLGLLVREPVGVVAAIIPWNAPLWLIAWKIAPALLAGCTVILKASPEAPAEALVMAEIFENIGLPPGVVNVLTADRAASEHLVRHSGVDKVTFTGSTAAGRKIASICGDRIARCTLELGGKSAALILDDADLESVAESLSGSARSMTGQACASLTRIIVGRDRHDDLVDALSASFGKIRTGDPFDPATDMGPLAMARQRDRVEGYFAKGRDEGARVATGGRRPTHLDRGFYVEPTVFCNVNNNMTIAREEIFGPVLSVIPAKDEAEAVEIANDTIFGLNASVFTKDATRAYQVARKLRSGTVGHNSFRTDFSIAFGGFKQSGIGREGGKEGLMPFLETKTIILDDEPART